MAELVIHHPSGETTQHTLTSIPHVIGRDAVCDIPLDDPGTSRRHAKITPTGTGFAVEDLSSKNGTLVNGSPCTFHKLKDGDQINIGLITLVYREGQTGSRTVVISRDDATASRATRYISSERELLLSKQRLQTLYDLSERLTTVRSPQKLLEDAMAICFETLNFERGAVGVKPAGGTELDWPVVRNLREQEGELEISGTLLRRALEKGERVSFTDSGTYPSNPTVSMVEHGIRSAMCVPMIQADEVLGVLYGDRVSTAEPYGQEDIDFFAAIARQAAIGLINGRLLEEQKQIAQLHHDIDLARTIQKGLLPKVMPHHDGVEIAALNDPGNRVSGDFYDVIERDDGRIWLLIADVTGEGVPAALLTANLQAAVRVTISDTDDPSELLSRWNSLIYANTDSSKFITCALCLVDPGKGLVRLASAGHPHPLIIRTADRTRIDPLSEPTFPLGIVDDATFPTIDLSLEGEPFLFFCYTDGLTEAMNGEGEMFGLDPVLAVLTKAVNQPPQAIVDQVRSEVFRFVGDAPQSDDLTLLAARFG